jgi:hypothetical protein
MREEKGALVFTFHDIKNPFRQVDIFWQTNRRFKRFMKMRRK